MERKKETKLDIPDEDSYHIAYQQSEDQTRRAVRWTARRNLV